VIAIRQIAAAGRNVYALASDGGLYRFTGKGWDKLPPLNDPQDKRVIAERQHDEPHVLSKRGIIGRTFFTGKVWTAHIADAKQMSQGACEREADLIPGTEAIPLNVAVAEQQALFAPRKAPKKRKKK
jgi:hypothetical protein